MTEQSSRFFVLKKRVLGKQVQIFEYGHQAENKNQYSVDNRPVEEVGASALFILNKKRCWKLIAPLHLKVRYSPGNGSLQKPKKRNCPVFSGDD